MATFILISATLFVGCGGMKFTSAVSGGDTSTAQSMLNQGEADVNKNMAGGRTPIFYAVINDHDDMVRLLMDNGAKVDFRDDEGRSPLMYAVENDNDDMVRLLMEKGAKVDIQYKKRPNALSMAAGKGKDDLVKAMVEAGVNPDSRKAVAAVTSALMVYVQKRDGLPMVKFLVENGAHVDGFVGDHGVTKLYGVPLDDAEADEVVKYLVEKGATIRAGTIATALNKDREWGMELLEAKESVPSILLLSNIDDDELFNYLLERGADPTSQIERAASSGSIKALRKLVKAGGEFRDPWNPLEEAKNAETARVLVELGADVDRGFPVHEAVMDEDAERIRFLVNEAGADINKQNPGSRPIGDQTPMHVAAYRDKYDMLKVLLECKGPHQFNLKNEEGRTVLDHVSNSQLRKTLLDKGAKSANPY